MEARNDIVLNDLSNFLGSNVQDDGTQHLQNEPAHHEFSLPQADGGKQAWLFLAAGFVVEALVWGRCIDFRSARHQKFHIVTILTLLKAFHSRLVFFKNTTVRMSHFQKSLRELQSLEQQLRYKQLSAPLVCATL